MRVIQDPDRNKLISAVMGEIPCDLSIENVQVVDMITGEIYPGCIDIVDGIVVQVRRNGREPILPSKKTYDGKGRFAVPGCIDIHMHVESTMMTPENFANAAVKCGTTSVFVDPHEIGNVLGIPGIKFMIDNAKNTPLRQFNLASSCVPSVVGAEESGAEFNAKEIGELLDTDGVYGIAEMMDFYNVIHNGYKMHSIAKEGLKRNVLIQGHAPMLKDNEIAAYALAGPKDNHCSRSAQDVQENLHAGLYVHLQSSSLENGTMPAMIQGLKGMRYTDHVCLCNDDVHAKDLIETGHVNRLIKLVLKEGVDPIDAYRWSTYNSAHSAGLEDVGAIAPGYVADIQLLDVLDGQDPYAVFIEGKQITENKQVLEKKENLPIPEYVLGTTVRPVGLNSPSDLKLSVPNKEVTHVTTAILDYGQPGIRCECVYEDLPVKDGFIDISERDDLCFIAVWNRHNKDNHTIAIAKNIHLKTGAYASTVSHDCHNLTVIYKNIEDGFLAAKTLIECGGGFVATNQNKVIGTLELPVAGLMSTLPCEELVESIARMQEAADKVFDIPGNMMKLALVSLACTQNAVITDKGLFDGRTQTFYEQFK